MHKLKNNIQFNNVIRLPFDGTAKCCDEVARMVSIALQKQKEERVEIIFPVQWAMSPANIFHPAGGVIAQLDKLESMKKNYKFTGFAKNGELGVTAVRCY